MVSDLASGIFVFALSAIFIFVGWSIRIRKRMLIIHKLYLLLALFYGIWVVALLCLRFTHVENAQLIFVWDAVTNSVGAFIPVLSLCTAIVFVNAYNKLPAYAKYFFILPAITNIVIWTNPIFHLQYKTFSVIRSEIEFGPYMLVSGLYCYVCLIVGIVMMLRFVIRNSSPLYIKQCLLVILGDLVPLVVSLIATTTKTMPITATPLSFIPTIILIGLAIYRYHMFDIKPIATQHVLDWITDCYLVLSENGLVISYNKPFGKIFAGPYGITENRYLKDCMKQDDFSNKTVIYSLMTAVDSCREAQSMISYEQSITVMKDGSGVKNYYITDVSPLIVNEELSGFIVIYKDITQIKKSMKQLEDSQARMAEQERLASLGQMIGGVAHNLKTPIMSISGCVSAVEALVEECEESLGEHEVGPEDYKEIYEEIRGWLKKVIESAAYMSDIISAIKGQAASVNTTWETTFTVDELIKRVMLLMRHELFSSGCRLVMEQDFNQEILLHGDINNLIQVLNNLIANAVYAQKQSGGGDIAVGVKTDEENLLIYIKDTGTGVSPHIKNRLFKEMMTNKGKQGTGLGLYISDAVVRGKFGGLLWMEDNPGGGSIFGISIPLQVVTIKEKNEVEGDEAR